MSRTVAASPFDCDRRCSSSSSVGGTSFVRVIAIPIVTRQQTAPSQKTTKTQYGTLESVAPVMTFCITNSDTLARTAPAPVNRLWVRKPRGICIRRSRSEIKARYGSMAVLLPASTSQRQMTAIHSADTNGKRNKMTTHIRPPPSTKGFRLPHLGLHVLSLVAPMNGWINRPVIGPAMLRMGRYSGFAPSRRKMGLTAVWVSPKLNWTPKNPRFIQAMLPAVISGRRSSASVVFPPATAISTDIEALLTIGIEGSPEPSQDPCLSVIQKARP